MQTIATPAGLTATVGTQRFPIQSWSQVSRAYRALLERFDLGASRAPRCLILDARGRTVAHVSYNGRVWKGERWVPGDTPIYLPD
mgnify:CR=1 FL=1